MGNDNQHKKMQALDYDKRRKIRLRWTKGIYILFVSPALLCGMGALLPDATYYFIMQKLPFLVSWSALIESGTKGLISGYDKWVYLAALGLAFGFLTRNKVVNPLYSRFFEEFDDKTFSPLGKAKAYDALWGADIDQGDSHVMPFVLPKEGPRRIAWNKLSEIVETGLASAKQAKNGQTQVYSMFGWGVLVGPSGIGKSRLAVELARYLRRETRLDDPTKESAPLTKLKRGLTKIASWWRVQVLRNFCGPKDPWDTGWLRPRTAYIQLGSEADSAGEKNKKQAESFSEHDVRSRVHGELNMRLSNWRPRRPTFILLDDPREGDSSRAIDIFRENSTYYHHPVILLIVSHEVPLDLKLSKADNDGKDAWQQRGGLTGMLAFPIDIDITQPFSMREVRRVSVGALPRTMAIGNGRDEDVNQFIKKTTGHPFLVELAFYGLRQGIPLENINQKKLLAERVKRIIEAFERCGLKTESHLEAMMVATIAGSHTPVSKKALKAEYPAVDFNTDILCNLFPHETRENLLEEIPPIRPRIIGEAFVRALSLGKILPSFSLKNGVAKAWKIDPEGTMNSSLRLGFIENDPLSQAIMEPPEGAGIDPVKLVCAYAKTGIMLPREAVPGTTRHKQAAAMLLKARQYFAGLSAEELEHTLDYLITLPDTRLAYQRVRIDDWWELIQTLLAQYIGAESFSVASFTKRLGAVQKIARERIGRYRAPSDSENSGLKNTLLSCPAERLAELCLAVHAVHKEQGGCHAVRSCFAGVLAGNASLQACFKKAWDDDNATLMRAIAFLIDTEDDFLLLLRGISSSLAQYPPSRNRSLGCLCIIKDLCFCDFLQEESSDFPNLQNELAPLVQALTDPGEARLAAAPPGPAKATVQESDMVPHRKLIDLAEALAALYPEDHDFQLKRARAWRFYAVAAANKADLARCKECLEQLEALAARFLEDRDFQLERARAWRHYAFAAANKADLARCKECLEQVEALAARFLEDRDFQLERAQAWRHCAVAAANKADLARCKECLEQVEALAARFLEDRDFQIERTQAWRNYGFAAANKADLALCKECLEQVEALAARYPEDRDFQLGRAATWRYYAFAAANKADLALCKECLEQVEALAARFLEDRDFQFGRTQAWRFYAQAAANKADLALCKECLEQVEALAARFLEDSGFQLELARSWSAYALAAANKADLALCKECLEQVEALAARFLENRDFQLELAKSCSAYALAAAKKGDLALCKECLEQVEALTVRFLEDRDFQLERAATWRFYALAAANKGDLALCKKCLEQVEALAARYPEDADFQRERTETWEFYRLALRGS